jgi:hypothetical protein
VNTSDPKPQPDRLYRAVVSLIARTTRAKPGYSRTEALSLASETRLPRASSLPIRQAVLVSVGRRTVSNARRDQHGEGDVRGTATSDDLDTSPRYFPPVGHRKNVAGTFGDLAYSGVRFVTARRAS